MVDIAMYFTRKVAASLLALCLLDADNNQNKKVWQVSISQ